MKTEHAITLFGSVAKLASALGITDKAVYQWGETVPLLRQYQIRDLRPETPRSRKSRVVAEAR